MCISELTDSYKGSSSVLEKWSHYNFINIYDYYYKRVADIYIMVQKGEKLSDYQFGTGFEESLDMIYFINNKTDIITVGMRAVRQKKRNCGRLGCRSTELS